MTAKDIAIELVRICSFRHRDGRLYLDDALDTWSCLYASEHINEDYTNKEIKENNPTWQEIEKEMEKLPEYKGKTQTALDREANKPWDWDKVKPNGHF